MTSDISKMMPLHRDLLTEKWPHRIRTEIPIITGNCSKNPNWKKSFKRLS